MAYFSAASLKASLLRHLSVVFFYLVPMHNLTPKTNLLIFVIIFIILFTIWRQSFNSLLKSYLPRINLAVIGFNNLAEKIILELKQKPQLGFSLSFILEEKSDKKEIDGTPIFNNLKDLPALIEKRKINNVILATAPDSQELRALAIRMPAFKNNFYQFSGFLRNHLRQNSFGSYQQNVVFGKS
jgi:FlaA1/EpsC-like NDP-sugar epimerase